MIPPESVELLENNKGRINTPTSEESIVEIKDYKILSFWDRIDEMGVWDWHRKYPVKKSQYEVTDGYNWTLKLRNRNGRSKHCSGYEGFPRKFKDLMKELNTLFGSKIGT